MYITQPGETRRYPERKENLYTKILEVIAEYPKCVFVDADHVGSLQFSKIRAALRGKAVMVMGKNTILRKAVRSQYESNPKLKTLVPLIQGNQGLIFTKGDLAEIKELCDKERVQAPAKAGVIAPVDVHVPKQNTGMSPTQTSFFQALNIPTKISKGAVEILQDVHLIAEGDKVSASQATLLEKLAIKPFYYGLEFRTVWEDGNTYPASILEVSEEHLLKRFTEAVTNVTHLSLGLSYPTVLSAPFLLSRAYYNVLAISCGTEYKIEAVEKMLEAAKNAPAQTATTTSDAPKAEEKKEEEEEEEDDDMGFSLFD